jgi:hypothetical protein
MVVPLVACSACAPKIKFTVTPHELCPGTRVIAEFEVKGGRAKVTNDKQLAAQSGNVYVPTVTTTFVITVKPLVGRPKSKETQATVYEGTVSQPEASEIGFKPKCEGSSLVATLERPLAEWDPKLTVGSVESAEGRDVTVAHEGRQATLTARQPRSTAFDGTRLGGTWSITVPLLPTEKCDGAGSTPPDLIIVTALVTCGS